MLYSATIWFDLVSSLAVIFVLIIAYGHVQRLFVSQYYADLLLGLAFGGVAWLQMHMPLKPMDGLIIDLRNIPLALCAAFLGWRATLVCFLVVAITRFQIGGIGMPSAILAMMIVCFVGVTWAKLTRSFPQRKLHHVVLLSLLVSSHLNAAWILPEAARDWFLTNASLPFVFLNAVSITLSGYLLNLEQIKIAKEGRIAASIARDPDHGTWTKQAFEREIKLRVSAGNLQMPAGLLVIKIRHANFLMSMVPNFWRDKLLGLLHARLKGTFENADLAFSLNSSALAIPLDTEQFLNKEDLQTIAQRIIERESFQLSGDLSRLITVDTQAYSWAIDQTLDEALNAARFGVLTSKMSDTKVSNVDQNSSKKRTMAGKHKRSASQIFPNTNNDMLFGKATFLMKLGQAR